MNGSLLNMLAKYFSIIRNYVLSVLSQRKYTFYQQNTLLDDFRTNSRNIIGRIPSMVIPLLANQDLTPMLIKLSLLSFRKLTHVWYHSIFKGDLREGILINFLLLKGA